MKAETAIFGVVVILAMTLAMGALMLEFVATVAPRSTKLPSCLPQASIDGNETVIVNICSFKMKVKLLPCTNYTILTLNGVVSGCVIDLEPNDVVVAEGVVKALEVEGFVQPLT